MRSHRFINSLFYLVIQLVAKESNAKENNVGTRCLFVLFLDKRYVSQVIHFKPEIRHTHTKFSVFCIILLEDEPCCG